MFNLSLSPPQLELVAQPGKTVIQVYNVYNNDSQPITLKATVESWLPNGNDGNVKYLPATTSSQIASFSLSNSEFQLDQPFVVQPNQKRQVILKIKTAPNIQGDSYHTLFLSQLSSTPEVKNSSAFGQIGSHILLSVSSSENPSYQANIKQITTSPSLKDIFTSTIRISSEVENQGNFFFTTSGKISITKNGQTIKDLDLLPVNVAAHASRLLYCQDKSNPELAQECTISPPFWPGVYTATISLDNPVNIKPFSTTFFVFPYWLSLSLLTFGLLIAYILKSKSKRS